MTFMKHVGLFLKNHMVHLKRKCLTLPLLFMFPVVIVSLIGYMLFSFISQDEQDPVQVGLVDLDETEETQFMVQFLEGSSLFNQFLHINKLTENQAEKELESNTLTTYIAFPKNFIQDLYQGTTVDIPIIGNRQQPAESYMIYETMESVVRHIRSSQANILTMNYYAKQFEMNDDERNDFVFQQFQEFLLYTISRDQIVQENELTNQATSSPKDFFGIGIWFVVITIWVFMIYHFFTKETPTYIYQRMRLYGVTVLQQITAKIIISLLVSLLFIIPSLYGTLNVLDITLVNENILRLTFLITLFVVSLLLLIANLELLITSEKFRMLTQSALVLLIILLSGAIIPAIYYPPFLQDVMPYITSYLAMDWIQQITLNGRHHAEFFPLLIISGALLFLLLALSSWKERAQT
ncbi:ABC transporter ATP-binding protein [Oceanobacillus iheyensis HTE831]|uniref:ABC transporter ATP-binding protein n=2 Tax=Oceanobacillus iheyensis TaxID=182710 RepID=Q8EPH0_OCEIH|nr:ABC transporter ATP-binding protein [Oceanobacillus iheyensis HTE831]